MTQPVASKKTIESWLKNIPDIKFDKGMLYCTTCQELLVCKQKMHLIRHLASKKHKNVGGVSQNKFNLELMEVMIACNIPWNHLNKPILRKFLQRCIGGEYAQVTVPSETTLRKNYLSPARDKVKAKIFDELKGIYLWVSAAEVTDALGRTLLNVMVGKMDENSVTQGHLLACKVLEVTDESTVTNIVNSCLKQLWGNEHEDSVGKLLLFVTSVAPYMRQVGEVLKRTYVNMLHVTCLANSLEELAETVKSLYPFVDALVSSMKEVFSKAPQHVKLLKDNLTTAEMPPHPVSTRPDTWMLAVTYYYTYFDNIKSVVGQLLPSEGSEVESLQGLFENASVYEDLAFIHAHFSRVASAITQLKQSTSELTDAMNIIFDLRNYLFRLSGSVAEAVTEKFQAILNNNPGFSTLCLIMDLFSGKEIKSSVSSGGVASLEHFAYFKFAPVTLTDMEQSFSELKGIFMDKRRNFTAGHLESMLIVHFYDSHNTGW